MNKNFVTTPLKVPVRSHWVTGIFYPRIAINQLYSSRLENFLPRRLTMPSDRSLFAFHGALSASWDIASQPPRRLLLRGFALDIRATIVTRGSYQGLTQGRQKFPSWPWTGCMWDLPPDEAFDLAYYIDIRKWRRVDIWRLSTSTNRDLEPWSITTLDVTPWDSPSLAPGGIFDADESWINNGLTGYFDIVK
jgi:hypothetical protein